MNKLSLLVAVALVCVAVLSSCKSHEKCAAYSKLDKPVIEKQVVSEKRS